MLFGKQAFGCLLFSVLLGAQVADPPGANDLETHFLAGNEALQAGQPKKAIVEFQRVLAIDPSLYQARVNLGLAYHSVGDLARAVDEFANARKTTRELGGANFVMGLDYLDLGKPALAIAPLEDAIRENIGGAEAREKLCSAFVKTERFADASRCAAELYGSPPADASGWYQLG